MPKRSEFLKAFLLLWGISLPVFGETLEGWNGKEVKKLSSTSFSKTELADLSRTLNLKVGRGLDLKKLDGGLQALHLRNVVQEIFIEGKKSGDGLEVMISGSRVRILRNVIYEGVDKSNVDILGVSFQAGKPVDLRALSDLQERLKEYYGDRGHLFAKVEIKSEETGTEEVDIRFKVVVGPASQIDTIRITGGPPDDSDGLLNVFGIRSGENFNKSSVNEGVDRINRYLKTSGYPTSKVEQVLYDYSEDKLKVGVRVLLKLEDRITFHFQGNTIFDEVQIRALLTEEVLSQMDANQRIAELIENKYREIGFHFCRVTFTEQVDERNKSRVIGFQIDEGTKVLIDRIHVVGGGSLGEDELRERFLLKAPGVLARGVFWEKGLKQAADALRASLTSDSYLSNSVSPPRVVFSTDKRGAEIFLDIEPGVRTQITQLDVKGIFYFPRASIDGWLGVKMGQPIDREQIEQGRALILQKYQSEGFLDVKFTDEEAILLSNNMRECTIRIHIIEGTQFRVGEIALVGNEKTESHVILREMRLKSGEVVNLSALRASEEDISVLGLFSRVEILATTNPKLVTRKDLKIVVKENRPGLGEVGFGGEFEDPTLRLRSFFGISYRNLFGLNQTAAFRGEVSLPFSSRYFIPFIEYSALIGYRLPYPAGVPLTFVSQISLDGFQTKPVGPTIQYRTRIENRVEKQLSSVVKAIYRLHRYERSNIEDLGANTQAIDIIGSTGPGLIFDFRDDTFNPNKGSYHTFDLEFAHPVLLSDPDTAFGMAVSRNSFYFPLFRPFRLAIFIGGGYADSLFEGKTLPAARLATDLALGGLLSIRGFNARQFEAPESTTTQVAFWNARAEVSFTLVSNVGAAVFFDSGQLFPELQPAARHDGVGFGIRYKTPVGPLVVDLAHGLGPDADQGIKFYFTVGTF